MLTCKTWAAAFINTIENEGGEIENGLNTLTALVSWVSRLPGTFSGSSAVEKLEPLIRDGIAAAGTFSSAQETAVRFFLLMIKKKAIHHVDSVIREIKNVLNRKRGIVAASVEYAFKPEEDFESLIIEAIKKRTGAVKVELTGQVKKELIGGYRLRIEDELIDASVLSQLNKMKACLAAGDGGNHW